MLLLVAHGSRRPEWRAAVERVVQEAQDELGERHTVKLAYMDCTPPTVLDVVAEAMSEGLASVRVLPLFLADEGHVNRDVRPLVNEVRQAYPGLDVEMLPAMGQHPSFVKLIYEIAESTG
jgi:sirohydrochlorin cobaltochelatase